MKPSATKLASNRPANGYQARLAEAEELAIERENRPTRSDTRARLLVAALELFSQNGFNASTMRDLAQFAGIKAPAIYNHFKSKEELLGEALLWAMDDFNEHVLGPANRDAETADLLEGILERHIRYQAENPVIARAFDILTSHNLLQRIGEVAFQRALHERLKHYVGEVTRCVSLLAVGTQDPKDHRIIANAITTMYDQVVRWHPSTSKAGDDYLIAKYWELTKAMLGRPKAS